MRGEEGGGAPLQSILTRWGGKENGGEAWKTNWLSIPPLIESGEGEGRRGGGGICQFFNPVLKEGERTQMSNRKRHFECANISGDGVRRRREKVRGTILFPFPSDRGKGKGGKHVSNNGRESSFHRLVRYTEKGEREFSSFSYRLHSKTREKEGRQKVTSQRNI